MFFFNTKFFFPILLIIVGLISAGALGLLIKNNVSFKRPIIDVSTLTIQDLPSDIEKKDWGDTTSTPASFPGTEAATINLAVPYLSQMPDDQLVKPWSKACEEASIAMIEEFYLKNEALFLDKAAGKKRMSQLFAWEDKNFGYNDDTDASSTARIINEYSSFNATLKQNPTLEEIKNELKNNRPVISLHYGPGLNNPYLHFSKEGPGYHVIVLKGYDNEKKEFIAHDPGTHEYSGDNYRYSYETIMSSLHGYDVKTKKAENGIPVVLFTSPDNR